MKRNKGVNPRALAVKGFLIVMVFAFAWLVYKRVEGKKLALLAQIQQCNIPSNALYFLSLLSQQEGYDFAEVVTVYQIQNQFFPEKKIAPSLEQLQVDFIGNYQKIKNSAGKKEIQKYSHIYASLLTDIKVFPIPAYDGEAPYIYGDSFGEPRTYGGDRPHLGCDILDRENIEGRIPILSMTDGVVEKIGWNEKGGWRVGIRSASGNYYYYAHLDRYPDDLYESKTVAAGDVIGYMGSTGYGKKEGTKGNFVVHLHLGIMVDTPLTKEEFWINPYPFLRYIENP